MHSRSSTNSSTDDIQHLCEFCQQTTIAPYLLKETDNFRIIADHAPLVEGHLLIVPRQHYACYGAVPARLDAELLTLKQEVRAFFLDFYAAPVYWEHGVFHQTVFHAHLHCFPFGETHYALSEELHTLVVHSQDDIRAWYTTQGPYFYLEDDEHALLFAPQADAYRRVIQQALWSGVVARTGNTTWRSAQQRQLEGVASIASLKEKWQQGYGRKLL